MGHDRLLVWEGQKGTKQGRGVMVQCSQGRHHHRAWRVQGQTPAFALCDGETL